MRRSRSSASRWRRQRFSATSSPPRCSALALGVGQRAVADDHPQEAEQHVAVADRQAAAADHPELVVARHVHEVARPLEPEPVEPRDHVRRRLARQDRGAAGRASASSGWTLCASSRQRRSSTEIGRRISASRSSTISCRSATASNPTMRGDGRRGRRRGDQRARRRVRAAAPRRDGARAGGRGRRRGASRPAWRGSSASPTPTRGCARWRSRRASAGARGSASWARPAAGRGGPRGRGRRGRAASGEPRRRGRTGRGESGGGEPPQAAAMRAAGAPVEPLSRARHRGADSVARAATTRGTAGSGTRWRGRSASGGRSHALAARLDIRRATVTDLDALEADAILVCAGLGTHGARPRARLMRTEPHVRVTYDAPARRRVRDLTRALRAAGRLDRPLRDRDAHPGDEPTMFDGLTPVSRARVRLARSRPGSTPTATASSRSRTGA